WHARPEGEQRHAAKRERVYGTLGAHPAVEAITYWGITDRGSWLGAPIGLLRADGSRKPSYDRLHGLIRGEWWRSPTPMRTGADGRVRLEGWLGRYRIAAGATAADVEIVRGTERAIARL